MRVGRAYLALSRGSGLLGTGGKVMSGCPFLSTVEELSRQQLDCLIIGSGPAGTAVAEQLYTEGNNLRIGILERGPLLTTSHISNVLRPQMDVPGLSEPTLLRDQARGQFIARHEAEAVDGRVSGRRHVDHGVRRARHRRRRAPAAVLRRRPGRLRHGRSRALADQPQDCWRASIRRPRGDVTCRSASARGRCRPGRCASCRSATRTSRRGASTCGRGPTPTSAWATTAPPAGCGTCWCATTRARAATCASGGCSWRPTRTPTG